MFGRRRKHELEDEEALEDVRRFVPASVKAPELQRFAQPDLEPDDVGEDVDLEFLARLTDATDNDAPREPAPYRVPATPSRVADDLGAFREVRMAEVEPGLSEKLRVPHVDLDELLDDLSTTAAALRRRKAA
jgi:hypothetical protein